MKPLLTLSLAAALLLCGGRAVQAFEPTQNSGCDTGVCAFLTNYFCCKAPYCGKPAPCPPACGHCVCPDCYVPKPAPCIGCYPLKWCPDCYVEKPFPCWFPKGPCPCP